jgi:hypothetical protein
MPIGALDNIVRIADLDYIGSSDSAEVDIKVIVPSEEPAGTRSSIVTFFAGRAN